MRLSYPQPEEIVADANAHLSNGDSDIPSNYMAVAWDQPRVAPAVAAAAEEADVT